MPNALNLYIDAVCRCAALQGHSCLTVKKIQKEKRAGQQEAEGGMRASVQTRAARGYRSAGRARGRVIGGTRIVS
jgi:hypothetical protein